MQKTESGSTAEQRQKDEANAEKMKTKTGAEK
jgi:hypothetical protein